MNPILHGTRGRARPFIIRLLAGGLLATLVVPLGCSRAAEDEGGNASAATGEADKASTLPAVERLRASLAEDYPEFSVDAIRPTPLDGVFEVVSGANVMYMTADGRYMLRGQLIDLQEKRNLTSQRRSELLHARVESLGEESMLVYEPSQGPARHRITVFTDPSCPYCRRLHEELLTMVEEYPVEVRYLMFPRAGLDSAAAGTLKDIWCADDPQDAMTRAKRGKSVPARESGCQTPIREHFRAAQEVGINGTPYLLLGEEGPAVSGYRPKQQLLSMLGISGSGSGEPEAAAGGGAERASTE